MNALQGSIKDMRKAGSNKFKPLSEDTVGPYYHYSFLDGDRQDLTRLHRGLMVRPKGAPIVLRGHLLDAERHPIVDAIVEFWQANADGVYRTPATTKNLGLDPYFDGYGRLMTTDEPFEFRTVKPGPAAMGRRAPNITVTIFSDGVTRLVTQIFFDDEEANAADPLLLSLPLELRPKLIARKIGASADGVVYDITIITRGDGETPFFDDLSS